MIKRIKLLRKIGFENYKSFKNYTELEIKPITVLVGPNSAGKSSIIKLLKILAQSTLFPLSNKLLNTKRGPFITINDTREMVFDYSMKKILKIDMTFDRIQIMPDDYGDTINFCFRSPIKVKSLSESKYVIKTTKFIEDAKSPKTFRGFNRNKTKEKSETLTFVNSLNPFNKQDFRLSYDLSHNIQKRFQDFYKFIDKDLKEIIRKYIKVNTQKKDLIYFFIYLLRRDIEYKIKYNSFYLFNNSCNEFEQYSKEEYLNDICRNCAEYFENNDVNMKHNIDDIDITSKVREINIEKKYFHYNNFYRSELLEKIKVICKGINSSFNSLKESNELQMTTLISFLYERIFFPIFENEYNLIENKLSEMNINQSINSCFNNFSTFAALREKPKSFYDSQDIGEFIPELSYMNDASKYLTNINIVANYFYKILGFNEKFYIKQIKEKSSFHSYYTIAITSSNNKNYDLSNVGFGHSQIIPFILKSVAVCKSNSENELTLFEQPELHLHPNIQYKLAELFENYGMLQLDKDGETFSRKDKRTSQLVIETHSEHLIRGFQVQVAKGNLNKDDIAIYYVSKDENGVSSIKEMELHDNGLFKSKWPKGFFDVTLEASLELLGN